MVRVLILLTSAAVTLVGCALLKHTDPLQVTVVGVEPAKGEGLEMRMDLKLRIQNPNDAAIDYNGVYVEFDVENKNLGSGVANQSGTLPAFGEALVTVPVEVSYWGIAGEAMGFLGGKSFDKVSYEMRGKLNSPSSGAVSFKSKGELDLGSLMSGGK